MVTEQFTKPRVIKRADIEARQLDHTRSELSLLQILIERNPERAKEFLKRLEMSCKTQDVVVTF